MTSTSLAHRPHTDIDVAMETKLEGESSSIVTAKTLVTPSTIPRPGLVHNSNMDIVGINDSSLSS